MWRIASAILFALLAGTADAQPGRPDLSVTPVGFETLPGWASDDHAAALRAFLVACAAMPTDVSLEAAPAALFASSCRDAAAIDPAGLPAEARPFFERHFTPFRVGPAARNGFLTGYYEPVLDGSPVATDEFTAPLLSRPAGSAALPDRAAIEAGALRDTTRPVVFLRDRVAAFTVQVQGSARIRYPDGRDVRVGYDGRNGHPYTSVGRVLADRLGIAPAAMTADAVWAWLRANPDEAPAAMARNASFIFFRLDPAIDPSSGPTGAAGWPLTSGRSLAVDAGVWPYGLPVWLDGTIPDGRGGYEPLGCLTVAGDTGSAIRGAARGDLFVGSGDEAGRIAGAMRERVDFVVLWPAGLGPPALAAP